MESMTLLTVAVGFIGVFHIAERVARFLAKEKSAAVPATASRNTWYCFFRMSSLLGPDWKPFEQRGLDRSNQRDTRREEKRRQQVGRPRLYV